MQKNGLVFDTITDLELSFKGKICLKLPPNKKKYINVLYSTLLEESWPLGTKPLLI